MTQRSALAFADLEHLTAGRTGTVDVPCPLCSSLHNPRRKVLRIWRQEPAFASYHCARCSASGWAGEKTAGRMKKNAGLRSFNPEDAAKREEQERARKLHLARRLWASRHPIQGTPAERYLRDARGYRGCIPATLAYLPANGPHPHALVSAFGMAAEPEPGVLEIADDAVAGIHLTKLNPDGSGKSGGVDAPKIMLGRSSGFPIMVAPPNDLLGLAITEGIEDAMSVHQATGLGAWAAGAAGRMLALADKIPAFIDCVSIFAHPDPAGQAGAIALADALLARGTETIILGAAA